MSEPALEVVSGGVQVPSRDDAAVLAEVTSHVTRYMAAHLIVNPGFPNRKKLPKSLPPPFCNFGHLILVDYDRLLRIVWRVALDARTAAMKTGARGMQWVTRVTALVWLLSLLSLNAPIIGCLGIVLVGVVMYGIRVLKEACEAVAKVRADALEQLLENRFGEGESQVCVDRRHFGDGVLDGAAVPVLTVLPNGPSFPGYGKLQADNLFVCRPKDEGKPQAVVDLARSICTRVAAKAAEQLQVIVRQGEVIVVHGGNLSTQSGWLGLDCAPILWFPRAELGRVLDVDPHVSVRVFLATQLVFPHYATAATFFLRVFPAGNSIAFQISVTTLGPPAAEREDFLVRLSRHKLQLQAKERAAARTYEPGRRFEHRLRPTWKASPATRDAFRYLAYAAYTHKAGTPFQDFFNLKKLRKLNISDEQHRSADCEQTFHQIVHDSPLWPGRLFGASANLREERSLTFLSDFFGRPEALAHIHTVYDQIVRTILETIEEGGFDISQYRDSNGKLLIQAGKIDQLVVGEKVTMQDSKEPQGGQREAPKQQAA